jgi:RimJ/RimL family protein N-acetyltransferase
LVPNPHWIICTGRLVLTPVQPSDLRDLQAIKADPRVFALMYGGVRSPAQAAEELAHDIAAWAANGFGMWVVRTRIGEEMRGITALMDRPDGRGIALRFAFWPQAQRRGLAREAAAAALRFGHERAGLWRIIAIARENNFSSRTVLGSIGMWPCGDFIQNGYKMILYESIR